MLVTLVVQVLGGVGDVARDGGGAVEIRSHQRAVPQRWQIGRDQDDAELRVLAEAEPSGCGSAQGGDPRTEKRASPRMTIGTIRLLERMASPMVESDPAVLMTLPKGGRPGIGIRADGGDDPDDDQGRTAKSPVAPTGQDRQSKKHRVGTAKLTPMSHGHCVYPLGCQGPRLEACPARRSTSTRVRAAPRTPAT